MSWKPELEELKKRKALAKKMGGADKVKRHRDAGKLTVRERIDKLLDAESFHEIGTIAGKGSYDENGELVDFTPANFVIGRGRIEGRPVVVGGDDFTVRGGAADAAIRGKQVMAEQMAHELRLPLIRLVDGTGGGGSVKTIETMGFTYVPANPAWDFELSLVIQNHLFWIMGALILCMPVFHYAKDWMAKTFAPTTLLRIQFATIAINLVLLLISVSLLVGKSYNPFLYFRF